MVKQFFTKILCLLLCLSIFAPPVVYAAKSSPAVLARNKNHFEPKQGAGDKSPTLGRGGFTNGNVIKTERQADDAATAWQTTEFTYDILNKLETVKDPLNRVTTYNYDNNENLDSIVDAELNTTSYVYDERELLFTVADANTLAGVTTYDYDLNGNLAKITDANNNPTTYAYDLFDRLDITQYADLSSSNYDKNSNLIRHTTPSGKPIEYSYDVLNRLTTKTYPLTPALNTTYAYDLGGRLTDADNTDSQIHHAYDTLNRVLTTTQHLSPDTYNLNYQYDQAGNRTQLTYPSGKVLDYTYDANDRLTDITHNTLNFLQYQYDPLDRRDTKTFVNLLPQQQTDYTFDIANQLASLTNTVLPGTNISTHAYPLYDAVGNRKQYDRTFQANPTATINYGYNDIYELTTVTGAQTNSYDYDLVGNREPADGVSYTPNNLNQYTNVGGATYLHDDNGNLTFDGTNTYAYDEENRLLTFTNGTDNASYAYDAFNRRVSKTVNGTPTYFVYDGDSVIAEYDGAGALNAEYVLVDSTDEVLAMVRGGNPYYYFYDGLGSVSEITDSTGAVVEDYTYDVYGNPSVINSIIGNPYRFTGQEFDEESGLYHYNRRTYDPTIGAFLQRDPLGYIDNMNLHSYTLNNPVNYTDPSGEIIDILADIGFIGYDLYRLASDYAKGCKNNFKGNLAALGGDVAGAFVPGLTGVGLAIREVRAVKQITVIGSKADTLKYLGKKGYNVLNIKNWTPGKNIKWLDEAIERGDDIKMVTDPIKHQELMQKLNKPSAFLDLELPHLLEKGIIP